MSWQLADTPHNFHCEADSYKVAPSNHTTLRVYRLFGNADAANQSLTIHDNFNETADLKIVVEDGNASSTKLINDIESETNSTPNHDLTAATIATVRKSYPAASEGLVNWVTGELLDKMGNPGAAKLVLQKASQDPVLKAQPQFKLDFGAVLAKTGDRNQSKLLLDDVSRHKDPFYATQAMTTMQESNIPANRFGNRAFNPHTTIEKGQSNPKFDSTRVANVPK
jgi:hypothetical protein